eukprot:CAMPEP_0203684604 /NCGR_PEP_ID=MMETSP0090-20130426/48121_1 /ASSEMBLY_ACC=CAM_ASM_001088 /TAXON_ID=426623 /ORGANISM="Chaetoceros affinis, Strain CCMP159" /LENGTH=441 /DNA_ID=CAMNT_0050553781 /DNA_START=52 /DNA_END=1377 /DNA_ORIENTATION=+
MPKAEKGSAKDIANKMKAKGLQKLKFFCQMCNKQCRDENGFKCHLTSDSHLRNMKSFCSNATGMLDQFSAEFKKTYLDTLYRRHRTKKMSANNVYQEVIQDKEHVHMNATKWATLTDFVQYLGKMGKCVVEETERGWYVTFIERDPEILAQQENYKRRVEAEKREERKVAKRMEMQRIEAAKLMDRAGVGVNVEASNLDRTSDDAPIALKLGGGNGAEKAKKKKKASVFGNDGDDDEDSEREEERLLAEMNKPIQKAEAIMKELETNRKRKRNPTEEQQRGIHLHSNDNNNDSRKKEKNSNTSKSNSKNDSDGLEDIRKKHWIRKDILTRIISKKVKKGQYYKRKCIVNKVYDKYIAKVEILDSGPGADDGGDIFEIDQDDLETVVPKVGKHVIILNGRGRGMVAELMSVDEKKCRRTLQLLDSDVILKKVDYNDFSKVVK